MRNPATEPNSRALIDQAIALAGTFKALLLSEQRACHARDIIQIEKITGQKQKLMPEFVRLKSELTTTLKSIQLASDNHFADTELNYARDKYLELLEECLQLSQLNRTTINSALTHTTQTVEFLRRSLATESFEHYGKDGIHHSLPPARMDITA